MRSLSCFVIWSCITLHDKISFARCVWPWLHCVHIRASEAIKMQHSRCRKIEMLYYHCFFIVIIVYMPLFRMRIYEGFGYKIISIYMSMCRHIYVSCENMWGNAHNWDTSTTHTCYKRIRNYANKTFVLNNDKLFEIHEWYDWNMRLIICIFIDKQV